MAALAAFPWPLPCISIAALCTIAFNLHMLALPLFLLLLGPTCPHPLPPCYFCLPLSEPAAALGSPAPDFIVSPPQSHFSSV